MPLTIELVDAVAASLRAGGYRSAAQIFSQASHEHISRMGTNVPPAIRLRVQRCVRATERGRGPSELKDSFIVEDLSSMQTNDKAEAECWNMDPHRLVDALLICCWWMLRGIARLRHPRFVRAWTEEHIEAVTHSSRCLATKLTLLACA